MKTETMTKYIEMLVAVILSVLFGVLFAAGVMYISKHATTSSTTRSVICNHEVKLSGKGELYQNGTIYILDGKRYNMKDGELCWIEEVK